MTRQAETDDEGRLTFDPLPAGAYVVQPVEYQNVLGKKGTIRRPLPGVFTPQKVALQEGETPQPIEIRATPYVVIEAGWIDSKGKPRNGRDLLISGHIDDQTWHTMVHPSPEGKFSVQVPHGMERTQITIFPGQLTSTRYRVGKDGKLEAGQFVMFGTLDHDVKDLQIVRYEETAVDRQGDREGRPADQGPHPGRRIRGRDREGKRQVQCEERCPHGNRVRTSGRRPVPRDGAHARPRAEYHRRCRRVSAPASREIRLPEVNPPE